MALNQLRIVNMILGTAQYTAKMNYTSPYCLACEKEGNIHEEDITHLFLTCPNLTELWTGLLLWEPIRILDPDITGKNVLLWHSNKDKAHELTLNIFFLLLKNFIFKCKVSGQKPNSIGTKVYIHKYARWISQSLTRTKTAHYVDTFDNTPHYVNLWGKIFSLKLM